MKMARWSLLALTVAAALGLAVWVVARSHGNEDWPVPDEAKKVKNPVPVTAAGLAAARELFLAKCSHCHGETGKGDGDMADMYDPRPADLTEAHMMNEMTDGEIFYKISEGRDPMPAFKKKFSEEERWRLVHYVRTLSAKRDPAEKKPGSSHSH